jgi:predicted enzyme related to lactoylglutathione lyase
MLQGLRTLVYHVADVEKAKAWYSEVLGQTPYFDEPFYVGFNVGGYELGLAASDAPEVGQAGSAVVYWGVTDVDAALAHLLTLGAQTHEAAYDVGEGIRLGSVIDPFGNILGVIDNPHFVLQAD